MRYYGRGEARIRNTERIDQLHCFLSDFPAKFIDFPGDGSRLQASEGAVFEIPTFVEFDLRESKQIA